MLIELKKRFGLIPELAPAYLWQWEASYIVFDPEKGLFIFAETTTSCSWSGYFTYNDCPV